jgi:hypothetical protein
MTGDSEDRPRRTPTTAGISIPKLFGTETMRVGLLQQLQNIRDSLCRANAANGVVGDLYASGYGAGVEAMWEAAEDAVKAWEGTKQ